MHVEPLKICTELHPAKKVQLSIEKFLFGLCSVRPKLMYVTAVWGKKKHKAHTTHRMYCMSVRAIRNLKQETPIGMRVDVLDRGTRIRCTGSSFALVGDFANDAAKTGEAGTACSARC